MMRMEDGFNRDTISVIPRPVTWYRFAAPPCMTVLFCYTRSCLTCLCETV